MVRLMLASIVGAVGYLLVFAGIAERGRWALRPWDALSQATNTPTSDAGSSGGGSSGGGLSGFLGKLSDLANPISGAVSGALGGG